MKDVDDNSWKKELETCKNFLVGGDMENERHRFYNLAMDSLDPKNLLEKIDVSLDRLKCAAELNVAFGFVLKNVEDCRFRYYYAHKNLTLLERSELVAATEDLTKIKNLLSNTDVIESRTRDRAITKWKIYKLTNITCFAALLKEVPMGCKNTVLPEPLLKKHPLSCLTNEENSRRPYSDSLCLLRFLAWILHGNERLESETSKILSLFLEKAVGIDPVNFQGVCMEDIAIEEDIVKGDIFWYNIDIVDGSKISEHARASAGRHFNTVRLLRYVSHFCHFYNNNDLFKAYRCPLCDEFIKRACDLLWHLTTCKKRFKHVFPKLFVSCERHYLTN